MSVEKQRREPNMKRANEVNLNTKGYWDEVYKTPEKRRGYAAQGTDSTCSDVGKQTYRFSRTLEEIKEGDRFLDIGCGVGVLTSLVKNTYPSCEVWGTDISQQAIEDNIREHPGIHYFAQLVGSQDKLNDEYFDVVFSGEVLEHLDNPADLIKDGYRVLKTGGKLIITTPLNDTITSPEHTWFFNQQDVEELFLNNGFNDITFVYLPEQEHLMVIYAIGVKQ